ncbi:hypothetical protein [Enterococcus faecium]|uniref:hypothetical protein n=1 Tax=Enterococcus faecium TaxID=1352 RepID=UPI0022E7D571|nr:hypothetical protein [Enterococcus faecium]
MGNFHDDYPGNLNRYYRIRGDEASPRRQNNAGTTSNGRDEALEILDQRYAKGELSDE